MLQKSYLTITHYSSTNLHATIINQKHKRITHKLYQCSTEAKKNKKKICLHMFEKDPEVRQLFVYIQKQKIDTKTYDDVKIANEKWSFAKNKKKKSEIYFFAQFT